MRRYSRCWAARALEHFAPCAIVATLMFVLQGCAGTAEGVTRGLVQSYREPQPRQCDVTGPGFEGLEVRLRRQENKLSATAAPASQTARVKVLMVHGIGSHPPGWSTRLQRNLSDALGLTVVSERSKKIDLVSSRFEGEPLGQLTIRRYSDEARRRELLAYELSWSVITAPKKESIAYDTSGEQEFKRANLNHVLKVFLNDRLVDPMAYLGPDGAMIRESASQALCWMTSREPRDLPDRIKGDCDDVLKADIEVMRETDFVFITHSLGSRIVSDMLQEDLSELEQVLGGAAATEEEKRTAEEMAGIVRNKDVRIYMLANQLPLLDLAGDPPKITGQTDAYCQPQGAKYGERSLNELFVVAFSDPNDPLSYAIPEGYGDDRMDSRLCPRLANVSVNVTDVFNLLDIGEVAHPLNAHLLYDNDERVIGIIAGGIGNKWTRPIVKSKCKWLRTEKD